MHPVLRRCCGNLILLLASAAFVEIALRPLLGGMEHVYLYDVGDEREGCGGLRASTQVSYTGWFTRIPSVVQEVNALGYRGPERAPEASDASLRIAIVGDSYAYGLGVASGDSIPALMEKTLRLRGRPDVEVLNFGVPGASLADAIVRLRAFVSRWHPDVVVLFLYADDLEKSLCAWQDQARLAYRVAHGGVADLWAQRDDVAALLAGALSMHSVVVRIGTLAYSMTSRAMFAMRPDDEWVGRLSDAIKVLQDDTTRIGSRLAVVVLGDPSGFRRTMAVAGTFESPWLDARGWVFGTRDERLDVIPGDLHFTAASNARAAEAVAAWLERLDMVGLESGAIVP